MTINYQRTSLYSLIADGQYRTTSAGRNVWLSLITGASLQQNCNQEGFNIDTKTVRIRLGLIANNENHCSSCDSWIGFGAFYADCGYNIDQTCGCRVVCTASTLSDLPAFGVILVQ